MTAGEPEPIPAVSRAMAVELLWAAWPASASRADDHRRAVEQVAAKVLDGCRDGGVSDEASATLDAAVYILSNGDTTAAELVSESFVPALLCLASHDRRRRDLPARHLPAPLWRAWHRTREELEAISASVERRHRRPPRFRPMAKDRVYRAENGLYVTLRPTRSARFRRDG